MSEPSRLEVGRIGRAHGLKGEVSVTLSSDRLERLAIGSVLYAESRPLVVTATRPHSGRWLVCFEGVDHRFGAATDDDVALAADLVLEVVVLELVVFVAHSDASASGVAATRS